MHTLPGHSDHNCILNTLLLLFIHNTHPLQRDSTTNASRQLLEVVPRNSLSALILSTLALIFVKSEYCSPTTSRTNNLIHLNRKVPRNQLAMWIVPQWYYDMHTEHSPMHTPMTSLTFRGETSRMLPYYR